MQLILLALLTSVSTTTPSTAECNYVKVCKVPQQKKQKAKKKKAPVRVVKKVKKECCQDCCKVVAAPVPVKAPIVDSRRSWSLGIRGAIGAWTCEPHVFALIGIRGKLLDAHLGFEVNHQFYWGAGFQAMVYPIQGPLSWHLNTGVLFPTELGFANQDVPRDWDVTFGTGLEFRVLPFLALTADFRTAIPNPDVLIRFSQPDENGRHLNTGNVIGNAFWRSQVLVGFLLHTN